MEEKLKSIFVESLNINEVDVTDNLAYSEHPKWDSVAHLLLVTAIEEAFDIYFEPDDVVDMSSFAKAKSIVSGYLE